MARKRQENGYFGETLKDALWEEYADLYKETRNFRPKRPENFATLSEDDVRNLARAMYAEYSEDADREEQAERQQEELAMGEPE